MTMIELTKEELQAVAGGQQNHGQATSYAVHLAQDIVYAMWGSPSGPPPHIMGTQVSYFARNGSVPA
jgi:bacteriocin-like protein